MEAVRTFAALGVLWVFVCWVYRDYRDDVLKQHLFGLRDELFDLAASGRVGFDDRAYGMTRSTINGFLLGAERINFLALAMFMVFGRTPEFVEIERTHRANWQGALQQLSADNRAAISSIRERMYFRIADHVFFTSPILWVLIVPVLVGVLVAVTGGALQRSAREAIVKISRIEDFDVVGAAMEEEPCLPRAVA